jgi:hypothetical protein
MQQCFKWLNTTQLHMKFLEYYNRCTCVKRECCREQVSMNGRQLRHLDSFRVLLAKINEGKYRNNKTCLLRGSGQLLQLSVSQVLGLFHFFFK